MLDYIKINQIFKYVFKYVSVIKYVLYVCLSEVNTWNNVYFNKYVKGRWNFNFKFIYFFNLQISNMTIGFNKLQNKLLIVT